ncbi:hypothetical protein FNV43_RR25676 [Rhamnella rubrinervis]|uniref:RIN4 pathogenic type III effector avirulence factor Avr cleavage site domain-containing protein n=1 Tax=Rhamnella rubrinervis TaxID=2594499 RepID=A0A8K0GN44_9ROSA|nr:hypothetical protein FNV43_RR25676 [Rhamnella rubrinervis]
MTMDTRKEKNAAWMSVPQFGGWDHKGATDYSMVFSRARANKKQQRNDVTELKRAKLGNGRDFLATHPAKLGNVDFVATHPAKLGNERELVDTHPQVEPTRRPQDDSVMRKRKILTYINCCIKP